MRLLDDNRGAVLIHVAFALVALMAFSTFVVDYGVFWESRRQAQNSADAAALSGATALAFDDPTDANGIPSASAYQASQHNLVWGLAPGVTPSTDIQTPSTGLTCPDGTGACVRVEVYRTAARGNALPIFFGQLVGLTSQDVQATATAEVMTANYARCLKPWAVMDQFIDNNGNGVFDPGIDTYTAPTDTSAGTGYSSLQPPVGSYGTELELKVGSGATRLSPGWFQGLDFGSGASTYRSAIEGCVPGAAHGIGDDVDAENGNMSGPTRQGVDALIALDPGASWDPTTQSIVGSCVQDGGCPGDTQSPRIVPVPLFDPSLFAATGEIKIVNILGFFVERVDGNGNESDVWGILINVPATFSGSNGTVGAPSSFLKTVALVR